MARYCFPAQKSLRVKNPLAGQVWRGHSELLAPCKKPQVHFASPAFPRGAALPRALAGDGTEPPAQPGRALPRSCGAGRFIPTASFGRGRSPTVPAARPGNCCPQK